MIVIDEEISEDKFRMHYFFTLKPKTYMFAVSSIIIDLREVLVPFVT